MTVAAVVIAPSSDEALAPHEGHPRVRHLVDVAWAGGAVPIVVVAPDPAGELARALIETSAVVVAPGDEPQGIAWFAAGLAGAHERVTETSAALLWPCRFTWVDPETVTSLIEAHGMTPTAIVRPAFGGAPGFPVLVPVALEDQLARQRGRHGEEALAALVAAGVPERIVELGDPGIIHDASTPRDELPPFEGPPEPAGGPPPDWNEALGARIAER